MRGRDQIQLGLDHNPFFDHKDMSEPTDIVINSFTAANTENCEVSVPLETLFFCCRSGSALELFPGCDVIEDPQLNFTSRTVTIRLAYTGWKEEHECPSCHGSRCHLHEWRDRVVKDGNLGPFRVVLVIRCPKIRCSDCHKTRWLAPSFVMKGHRITGRAYSEVVMLLNSAKGAISLTQIEELTGIEADIIRSIDKALLAERFKTLDYSKVRNIAIDEISIKKHHRYISVIIDADSRRLLYACNGRKKADLAPFFERLQELGLLGQIEGAVMDGNCGYQHLVKEFCPEARIVLDLFHCMQQYNREVADGVRIEQIKMLQDHLQKLGEVEDDRRAELKLSLRKQIKDLKQSKWYTYMGMQRMNSLQEAEDALQEMVKRNAPLATVAIMGDSLRELWHTARDPEKVRVAIDNWASQAEASGLAPLMRFGRKLKGWTEFIVHAATTGLNTSILEGCNNKFKVIKRVAYGFRDIGYFILKLHQALSEDRKSTLKPAVMAI